MATEQATKRTHCPNCGARLPEQPLSLCSYCAMPLGLDRPATRPGGESPHAARIAKIEEHESFPAIRETAPPESPDYYRGRSDIFRGRWLVAVGIAFGVVGAFSGEGVSYLWSVPALLAYALIGLGALSIVRGAQRSRSALALPLLVRPGLIVDRRSDTSLRGWGGDTTYYFTIEFADGVRAEFAYPGRGAHEEPYTTNLPGVAFTRGTQLLAFRHVRV